MESFQEFQHFSAKVILLCVKGRSYTRRKITMETILFFFPLRSETSVPRDCYSCSKIRNNCSVQVNAAFSAFFPPHDEFRRAVEACCDSHFTQHRLRLLPWGTGLPLPVQSYSPHHNTPLLLPLPLPRGQQRKELLPTNVPGFWVIPASSWYCAAACNDGITCSVVFFFFSPVTV